MASVDDRIVEMQFNNKTFEQRISQTLSSLDRLKGKLDFSRSKQGMDELQGAANRFNMNSIAQSVDNISSKFSAMGILFAGVMINMASRAVDAGARMVKSLAIDPILDGYNEYETNLNSIQTILANTKADGTNLQQVNAALDQLNTYSDQTIYNFGQMARNIGTFTAAGVDLDTSVNAIKGIANLAATSGSNADQASTAMYQLSQALASGKVSLMDWNSVVNAGMGGEVFQKALFETGKALGKLNGVPLGETFDDWKKKGNTFRSSLESGWVTADVLTTTLSAFTGDLDIAQLKALGYTEKQAAEMMELGKTGKAAATEVKTLRQLLGTVKEAVGSGWSASFRIIFGDFEEAKTLFTGLNNTIGGFVSRMSDSRNKVLQTWKDLGGRQDLLDALANAFSVVASVMTRVAKGFRQIFPAMTGERLAGLTFTLKEFLHSLIPSYEALDKLQRIFAGVFAVVKIGWTIVSQAFLAFKDLFAQFAKANGSGILEFFADLGDKLVAFQEKLVGGGGIYRFFQDVKDFIGIFITGFSGGLDGVGEATGRLGKRFGFLGDIVKKLGEGLGYLRDHFKDIRDGIADAFGSIGHAIAEVMKTGNFDEVFDVINTGLIAGILLVVRRLLNTGLSGLTGGLFGQINSTFRELTGVLKAMQTEIKSDALLKIAGAVGILTASVAVLALIDSAALTKALTAMAVGFGQLVGVMVILDKAVGSAGAAAKLTILATGLVALSTSMLILSAAAKVFATMNWGEIAKGMVGVAGMLTAVTIAVKFMPDSGGLVRAGIGITGIAIGIRILANAVEAMSKLSWADMAKGLAGVAGALTAVTIAVNFMPVAGVLAAGVGIAALAVGLNILSGAIAILGNMDPKALAQGLIGLSGALALIAIAMHAMPLSIPITGAGLVLVGVGLNAIATALVIVGSMNWDEIGKGLAGIAGALVILGVAMSAMQGTIGGAASIFIAASALVILSKALKEIGKMKWGEIGKGLAGIAAALALLGVAGLLLEPVVPSLLGLGAALLLVGAGFALFGIGAAGVANALKLIADTGSVAIDALLQVIEVLLDKLPDFARKLSEALIIVAKKLLAALPGMLDDLGKVIESLFESLAEAFPSVLDSIDQMIITLLDHLTTLFPLFVDKGFQLLMQLLLGISNNIGRITDTVVQIILNFLDALTLRMPEIVAAGLGLLTAFLQGIADNIQQVIDAGGNIIASVVTGIGDALTDIAIAAGDAIISFIKGIGDKMNDIVDAGVDTVISFIEGLGKNALELANAAGDVLVDFINGLADAIDSHSKELQDAGRRLAGSILDGMTFGLAGKAGGVIKSAVGIGGKAVGAVGSFLGIGSPSKVFMRLGERSAEGFALGFANDTKAADAAELWSTYVVHSVNRTLDKVRYSIGEIENLQPTITPVVDLSNVNMSVDRMQKMMGSVDTAMKIKQRADQIAADMPNRWNNSYWDEGKHKWINRDGLELFDKIDERYLIDALAARQIKFEQNIYANEAPSLSDIYRNTKSQLIMAKEELTKAS